MSRRLAAGAAAAGLWAAALAFHVGTLDVYNDHFDRITRGRQIARYGELPFRDFFDPGYFLAELSSAAMLWLFGDRLIGEVLLTGVFIATGGVLVLRLAQRASHSWSIGLAAAVLSLLLMPRPYDYDKVLFYPLGLWLCWRYVDRRRPADLVWLAGGIAAAGLYRYDSAAYVGLAAAVALAGVHWGAPRALAARSALLAGAVVLAAAPALLFIERTAGLREAADQMVTYGVNEARPLQLVVIEPASAATGTDPRPDAPRSARALPRLRMPDHLYAGPEGATVYFVTMALPIAGAAVLLGRRRRTGTADAETVRLWSLIALCAALNLFILRPPMMARLGGMAGPLAVLAAWLLRAAWDLPLHEPGRGWHARWLRAAAKGAALVLLVVTLRSTAVAAAWSERVALEVVGRSRIDGNVAALLESPPSPRRLSAGSIDGLAAYLRACTEPGDRLFATWFAPELYFFAQRGFAGRMAATWQWAEMRFQRRSVESLAPPSVIAIVDAEAYDAFRAQYPVLWWHLERQFRVAGASDFGQPSPSGARYRILVPRGRTATGAHAPSGVPCFA